MLTGGRGRWLPSVDWKDRWQRMDDMVSVVARYFHCDPFRLTLDNLHSYVAQLPRVLRWEKGQPMDADPAQAQGKSTDELVEAIQSGELGIQEFMAKVMGKPVAAANLTDEQKQAEAQRVAQMFARKDGIILGRKLPGAM